jgi:hypothetical protein
MQDIDGDAMLSQERLEGLSPALNLDLILDCFVDVGEADQIVLVEGHQGVWGVQFGGAKASKGDEGVAPSRDSFFPEGYDVGVVIANSEGFEGRAVSDGQLVALWGCWLLWFVFVHWNLLSEIELLERRGTYATSSVITVMNWSASMI